MTQHTDNENITLGTLTIEYLSPPDGDIEVGLHVEGDLPLVVLLGMLRLTEDTLLSGAHLDDTEDGP